MEDVVLPYLDKNHRLFESSGVIECSDYNFNINYLQAKNHENTNVLDDLNSSLDKIVKDCEKTLSNPNEKLFLDELLYFSKELLKKDLEYFKTSKKKQNHLMNGKDAFVIKLSKSAINFINLISKSRIRKFKEKIKNNKLTREDLSVNRGFINQLICLTLNIDFFLKGVNNIMTDYMGYKMHVTGCSHEMSTPKAAWWKNDFLAYKKAPKTAYYHYDESFQLPKAIVYLTDVTDKNGPVRIIHNSEDFFGLTPLQFLVGRIIGKIGRNKESKIKHLFNHKYHQTFGCENYVKYFNKLPDNLKFNSHFGWDVIPSSALEKKIINKEEIILGDKGTSLIFDGTKLLHRGGLIDEGERIVLQVIFEKKANFYYLKKIFSILSKKILKT